MVPRPTTVSPSVARSIAALAPISTSSSTRTVPTCGTLRCACPSQTYPKPSEPTTAPAWRTQRAPIRHPSRTAALGCRMQSSPIRSILAYEGARREDRARADAGAARTTVAPGATATPGPSRAERCTKAPRCDAALAPGAGAGRPPARRPARAAASRRERRACRPPPSRPRRAALPPRFATASAARRSSATQDRSERAGGLEGRDPRQRRGAAPRGRRPRPRRRRA